MEAGSHYQRGDAGYIGGGADSGVEAAGSGGDAADSGASGGERAIVPGEDRTAGPAFAGSGGERLARFAGPASAGNNRFARSVFTRSCCANHAISRASAHYFG